ncbi:major facilitator superfamily domain-containing protein [Dactylonectria macrodidyma]|uniref:Major facilitator superfamily domain-containing protein n=1 Tax=Dactylonectria macrodidyma TaxID=307937 RepID=A0A9P9FBW2_9HYPO|nr:major facilitator superfamily domain-containing protein [Dactylonectria macrodidyma]
MSEDIEKGSAATRVDTPSSYSTSTDSPVLEPIRTAGTQRSRHSFATRRSHESDIFEVLEHALTPDVETEAEREAREPITYTRTGTSIASAGSRPPDFEIIFEEGDPENPRNWPLWYRAWITVSVSYSTWVIVLYSTCYTSSIPGLIEEFDSTTTATTLGLTTYLLGLATGSLVVAPMSELFGRRPVYMICLTIWLLLIIPCALATSLTEILVVRFVGALFGAALISNSPGSIVDIADPEYLALAMSLWSIAPLNGPSLGPIIGGFVYQYLGWRWDNWIVLILGGVGTLMMATCKETYHPAILKKKAARIRKETDDPRWWCQYDQRVSSLHLLKVNLSRPFILFATEPILWFLNIWISVIYGILYLCFVAYPIVFAQHRGWNSGMAGLSFTGIGVGTMIAIVCEPLLRKLINAQPRDPETGRVQPEATALVMAIGSILTPIGQLVFSWTCLPSSIHWAIPIAFGIPFGAGNTLSFIYGANYLAGTYNIYAASALAGNAVIRSIFGATLPLAGPKMYEAMTPQWAGTLLGLLEVAMIPIPFIFWRYGAKIRAKSPAVQQLREEQDRIDAKRAKHQRRLERRRERVAAGEEDKN